MKPGKLTKKNFFIEHGQSYEIEKEPVHETKISVSLTFRILILCLLQKIHIYTKISET